MNENLNLLKILRDCPKGTKLYSTVLGEVEFDGINDIIGPIIVTTDTGNAECFTADGKMYNYYNGECLLFPSKEQRDWSKFKTKKPKFDPKTLQPFDKILVKRSDDVWVANLLSHSEIHTYGLGISYLEFIPISNGIYRHCIPYNEETKHLVGTKEEAPEYYRYWDE